MSLTHAELCEGNFNHAPSMPTQEWSITAYFYSAVHAFDHALFPGGLAPETGHDHRERESLAWHDKALRTVRREYLELKGLATRARYYPGVHPLTTPQLQRAKFLAHTIARRVGLLAPPAPPVPTPPAPVP